MTKIKAEIVNSVFYNIVVSLDSLLAFNSNTFSLRISHCTFSYLSGSSGTVCIYAKYCFVELSDICFSYIIPFYYDGSFHGGSCLHSESNNFRALFCSITRSSIGEKKAYGTFQLINSNANISGNNQSQAECTQASNYVNAYIIDINSKAILDDSILDSLVGGWSLLFASSCQCSSKRLLFNNITSDTSIIQIDKQERVELEFCACTNCKGKIINDLNVKYFIGWYSDQTLPSNFIQTTSDPIKVDYIPPKCKGDKYSNEFNNKSNVMFVLTCYSIALNCNIGKNYSK